MRPRTLALVLPVVRSSLLALCLLLGLAMLAGAVRVVPWLLDPSLPLEVSWVFARSVLAYLAEVALWAALPLGLAWALSIRLERGELQIPALLGEPPWRTLAGLGPWCCAWALALFVVSYASGKAAREPGTVMQRLLTQGEVACATAQERTSQAVPLLNAAWVCQPGSAPRLVGRSPLGGIAYVARRASVNSEVSAVDLQDASFLRELGQPGSTLTLHADRVHVGGMRPFVAAASLPAIARAGTAVSCLLLSTLVVAALLLRRSACPQALALAAGLAGPVAGMLVLAAAARHPVLGVVGAFAAALLLPTLALEFVPRWWQRVRAR